MANKQSKLPGFTSIDDDKVEEAAEEFVKARDAWQEAGVEMGKAKAVLLKAVESNKKIVSAAKAHPKGKVKVGDALITYSARDPRTNVKVKLYADDDEQGAADEGKGEEAAE